MKVLTALTLAASILFAMVPSAQAEPVEAFTASSDRDYIAPPVNPVPSFYELQRMGRSAAADIGVAPPVNPLPRRGIDNEAMSGVIRPSTQTQTTTTDAPTTRSAPTAIGGM